jgi:DNA-binding beta-propeller fold protein YncE
MALLRSLLFLLATLTLASGLRAAPYDTAADAVLGQSGFTTNAAAAGAAGLSSPAGVAADPVSGRLWVADFSNHRVLGWPSAATFASGQAADVLIGQSSFTGTSPNQGGLVSAATLNSPANVAVDAAGNLYVADRDNHRVLRYAPPFTSGMNAVQVFGQAGSFTTGTSNNGGISASSLAAPADVVAAPGGALYIDCP